MVNPLQLKGTYEERLFYQKQSVLFKLNHGMERIKWSGSFKVSGRSYFSDRNEGAFPTGSSSDNGPCVTRSVSLARERRPEFPRCPAIVNP